MSRSVSPRLERSDPRAYTLWACLALVGVVAALYGQVVTHEFVDLDDDAYIVRNPEVRQGLSWQGARWAFTTFHEGNWHPLTWLSHMLDCEVFGLHPGGHHFVNVLLHAASSVLLLLALSAWTEAFWPSTLVAALFAVHPLRVESVAWAAERKDVLSGLFFLLVLWTYGRYVKRPGAGRYLLVLLFLALGLLAKPMLVTLPFVLLLLDLWPMGRRLRLRLVVEKLPLFALSGMSIAVTLLAQRRGGAIRSFEMIPVGSRVANTCVATLAYLRKTIWPVDLAVFYPHPALIREAVFPGAAVFAGLGLAFLTILAVSAVRRRPYLLVGWLWYVVTLLPVSGLVQVGEQAMADRYTYLPLIGIYIVLAWGAREVAVRWRRLQPALALAASIALAAFASATWLQIGVWRDSRTLFEHALRVTRDNYLVLNNLGAWFERRDDLGKAEAALGGALRVKPDYAHAHYNLGVVLHREGKPENAAEEFERAIRIRPDFADAHYNLAIVLEGQGRLAEAAARYEEALRIRTDFVEARLNLGIVLGRLGRLSDAEAELGQVIRLRPDWFEARYNLAMVLLLRENFARAEEELREALRLRPDDARARAGLEDAREKLEQKR